MWYIEFKSKNEVRRLKNKVRELEATIKDMQDDLNSHKQEIDELAELIKRKNARLRECDELIEDLNNSKTDMISAFDTFFRAFQHAAGPEWPVFLKNSKEGIDTAEY